MYIVGIEIVQVHTYAHVHILYVYYSKPKSKLLTTLCINQPNPYNLYVGVKENFSYKKGILEVNDNKSCLKILDEARSIQCSTDLPEIQILETKEKNTKSYSTHTNYYAKIIDLTWGSEVITNGTCIHIFTSCQISKDKVTAWTQICIAKS